MSNPEIKSRYFLIASVRSGQEEEWLQRIPTGEGTASVFESGETNNVFEVFAFPKTPFVKPMINASTGELSYYSLATIQIGRQDYVEIDNREARFDPERGKLYVASKFQTYYPEGIILKPFQTELPKKLLEERAKNEEDFLKNHPILAPEFSDRHLFCGEERTPNIQVPTNLND